MYSEKTAPEEILVDQNVDWHRVCTVAYECRVTCNLCQRHYEITHPEDVKKDNFGKWKHLGFHNTPYHVRFDDKGEIELEKCAPGASGNDIFDV